ncbi:MAG: hypothetical protein LBU56_03600, partial [Rickettsiales bacterium]|nr:hypothetical protein [Rickettsiales bacterium]
MNKVILFVSVAVLLVFQACSKDKRRGTTDPVDKGGFANDPTTEIGSKDKKFLCDFQWTFGHKRWAYSFDGDKPITNSGEIEESWCLIPYGESTEYEIFVEDDTKTRYFCRDANSIYSIADESQIMIDYENDTYKIMNCVELNSGTIVITAGSVDKQFQDERLYHVVADRGKYSIAGHVNLRLVKPVHLNVLWEPIFSGTLLESDLNKEKINKIKEDWKKYMLKAGFYINIKTLPIVFPNSKSYHKEYDGMTLVEDVNVLKFPDAIDWYNTSRNAYPKLLNFFEDENISSYDNFDFIFTLAQRYYISYVVSRGGFYRRPGNISDYCTIASKFLSYEQPSVIITSSIKASDNGVCYDRNKELLSSHRLSGYHEAYRMCHTRNNTDCQRIYYYVARFNGDAIDVKNSDGFSYLSTAKGSMITDNNFFNAKNSGRLMAAATYSKFLNRKPISSDDELWLSSYADNSEVEQPSEHWKTREGGSGGQQNIQQQLMEFTLIMQDFK